MGHGITLLHNRLCRLHLMLLLLWLNSCRIRASLGLSWLPSLRLIAGLSMAILHSLQGFIIGPSFSCTVIWLSIYRGGLEPSFLGPHDPLRVSSFLSIFLLKLLVAISGKFIMCITECLAILWPLTLWVYIVREPYCLCDILARSWPGRSACLAARMPIAMMLHIKVCVLPWLAIIFLLRAVPGCCPCFTLTILV